MSLAVTSQSQSSGCVPISSDCVIWPGPDIPCINLCKGDTITKAIKNLADKLCSGTFGIVDISTLDFSCLVAEGQQDPTNVSGLLQLMIAKICQEITPAAPVEPNDSEIQLPACLQFNAGGVPVTSLPIEEYALLLAGQICELISLTNTHSNQISDILERVTALENAADPVADEILVSSQCVSSATPGQSIPISTAFVNLETYLCALKDVLGENDALSASVAAQCSGLALKPSLADPSKTMGQLAGWKNPASTLADSVQNLWITVCDIRTNLENC